MKQLFRKLSAIGSRYQLSFSAHELLGNYVFAIDGPKRKLLLARTDDLEEPVVLNIDEIEHCTLTKKFGAIQKGWVNWKKLRRSLTNLSLHLKLKNTEPAVEINLIDHETSTDISLIKLERKARRWEAIISKMRLPGQQRA